MLNNSKTDKTQVIPTYEVFSVLQYDTITMKEHAYYKYLQHQTWRFFYIKVLNMGLIRSSKKDGKREKWKERKERGGDECGIAVIYLYQEKSFRPFYIST